MQLDVLTIIQSNFKGIYAMIKSFNSLHNKRSKYFNKKYYNKGKEDWAELSAKCKQRAGYRCQKCKKDFNSKRYLLEAHHIIPLSKGGRNTLSNLICLCRSCHNKQHSHLKNRIGNSLNWK